MTAATADPTTMPTIKDAAELARSYHDQLLRWSGLGQLLDSARMYSDSWAPLEGGHVITADDSVPLREEALRLLVMKAAVYQLTGGDAVLAELRTTSGVDQMFNAVVIQASRMAEIRDLFGIVAVHETALEQLNYHEGCYTHQLYIATFGEEPPKLYWPTASVHPMATV